jgi:hypothetical protein
MLPTMKKASVSVVPRILAMLALSAAPVDRALPVVPPPRVPLLVRPAMIALPDIGKRHATSKSPLLLVAVGGGLRARGMADQSS